MSLHSDISSKKSQRLWQDGRIIDFYGTKIKSNGHSASSIISPVRKVKSPKLRAKSRQRSSCASSPPIQAKKVTFFRNGDPFFKGVVLAISSKIYPSIDSLILDANRHPICDVSVLPKGIRYVFSTDGKRITALDELQEGRGYVFSSTESFKPLQYGGANPILFRSQLPAETQHDESSVSSYHGEELDQLELSVNESCNFIPTRTIYIIRAGPRPRYTTKMTLNEGTETSLDQVIDSIEQNLMMCKGEIKHLCSVSGKEVKCLENLFEEDTIFIAFATEVISPDDLLLSAAELSTSPTETKTPPMIVWTNNLPRFPSDIKKPKIITVVNRGHAGDERGIPFALLAKYRVSKTVIWTDCAVMKRGYAKADSRQAVAMKIFDKSRLTSDELDAVYYELSMLRRLKHNNILHFFDEMDTIPELYVLVEYFMGTNLLDAILLSEFFTEREARSLMGQLCSAISYLHSLSIIHRNIKPDNILVSCDRHVEDWQLRLVGLTSAVQIKEDSISELCGTLEYAAPEILKGLRYGSKVDVWSAGVICYQMLSGLLPFTCSEAAGDQQQQLIQSILSGHVDFPSPCWDSISDTVKDLILHMLTRNPKLRCKAIDVFSHSWLQTTMSHSPTYLRKNVNIRSTVVRNLEISNPWASTTTKSCHMLLASSFCSPRKAYEERTSSPDHETRLSFSSHSVLSGSDSNQSLFKLSASPKGYRYISCPSDVGASQNDATHVDTNISRSSLDLESLLPTDRTLVQSNNIESSGFDFNSSQLCMDQNNSLLCDRVDVVSQKTDAASGNFDSSHFCQDNGASTLTGTSSSKSDIFSSHSVSTQNTSQSDRCISAVKQPCSASTQTTSSELLIPPATHPPEAPADNTISSSSSATPSLVASNGAKVTQPEMNSPRSRIPFPLSLLFSTVPSPSSVKPSPAQNTAVSSNTDYQLMTAQMCSAHQGGGLPSGHDSTSGRSTNTKSTSAGSASSSINSAHMENCKLLPNQSLAPSHGQKFSPPVLTLRPSNPSSSAFNHSGLPILQFVPSTRSPLSPKPSQSKHAPSSSSSPLVKSRVVSNLPISQHSTQAYQQNQLASARSFPQYASSPIQDSQHIQTLPRSSVQSSQAPSNTSPSIPDNRLNCTARQHGFSPRPKESNFHPAHRQSRSVSHASTSTEIDQPQLSDTHASPSQMLTAALKSFDPEDHTKDARPSSGSQKTNMNMAKVAVETVCWMSSNPQKSLDKEQTGKRDEPLTSPAHNKDGSPASSSSSHDEFLSPSSSIQDGSGYSSQTRLSGFSEGDNDDADSTSSWSTHCSIKNES